MPKKIIILIIAVVLCSPGIVFADTDIWLDISTVVVTGTRITGNFPGRRVSVISREEIKNSTARSVPELLKSNLDTDIQERSPYGIQADVSIRGSSYQQSLILIDGTRVNDSQTAHHNLDLPLALNDIERIEVLNGQGSSVYGPDAFAGVVNIITKKPQKDEFSAQLKIAGFNTRIFAVSAGNKWENFSQKVSLEKKKSDGFRYDTDFDNFNFSSKSSWEYPLNSVNLGLGYMEKEFGAFDFYSPGKNLPSREWTKTYFTNLGCKYYLEGITLQPKIFFRQHNDKFMLDITRPSYYVNEHVTYYYGGEIQAGIPFRNDTSLLIGAEAVQEQIESLRLGNHIQPRQALFGEVNQVLSSKTALNAGLRYDSSSWGQQVSPTININNRISEEWNLRVSAGKAFRNPSFTELYYTDPVTQGNPSLKTEEAISYDAGADFNPSDIFTLSFTFFDRDQENLIDWVGQSSVGPWKSENIGKSSVYGFESAIKMQIYSFAANLQYSWTGSKLDKVYFSKYALNYPANQCSLQVSRQFAWGITPSAEVLYKYRSASNNYTLMNAKVSKAIGNVSCYLEGTNLFDQQYEDIPGIQQPGRWIGIGFNWDI